MLEPYINKKYFYVETLDKLRSKFLDSKPFSYLVLDDFLDEKFVNKLLKELKKEKFDFKDSDLFTFFQTNKDLASSNNKTIKEFYKIINSKEFKDFLFEITNIKAFGNADSSGFIYTNTHHLLPHDDRLEKRKIAYVYYLTTLNKKDGGSLDLFSNNMISKSIIPKFNSFVIFKVQTNKSFHQVSEVLTDKQRITVAGWFNDK